MAEKAKRGNVRLTIPLDASGIEGFKPEQPVKVLVTDGKGRPVADAQSVKLDAKGMGSATISVPAATGVRVILGPADATDEEMVGLQTVTLDIPGRQLREQPELTLTSIIIPPYYWWWWLHWCRRFVIHGRVVCPDGKPVPGATVCAFDVDAWWWWWSKQQIGCATTDINGAFTISFRWCCGWWPWWWWRNRYWYLEQRLADRLLEALRLQRPFGALPAPTPEPDVAVFETLLPNTRAAAGRQPMPASLQAAGSALPAALEGIGERLRAVLPFPPGLQGLHLWPWYPWRPWWDCHPDIIFTVTQHCQGGLQTILDEGYFDTRWNVPQVTNVTLVATNDACCRPDGCTEDDCLVIANVCSDDVANVGGNLGAPAAPIGYANPGIVSITGDRPYADLVRVRGTAQCLTGVDYYEIEYRPEGGAVWNPVQAAALGAFSRHYFDFPTLTSGYPGFAPTPISGHQVYESLEHYEVTHPALWGINRVWLSDNYDTICYWLTKGTFADGTYHLRVKAWNEVGGNLVNPRILDLCGPSTADNDVVITIDNQIKFPPAAAPADNPCDNIIHLCTNEPNSDILAVTLIKPGGPVEVAACGRYEVGPNDVLQIDFIAHDADGHLAYYDLQTKFGENESVQNLEFLGTLTPLGGAPVPPAVQVGPRYTDARSGALPPYGGAVAPTWAGGAVRLEMKAAKAFPKTCCYQIQLRVYKRTIVSCQYDFDHYNVSEYSFMITL
jgi:hypothetical protein